MSAPFTRLSDHISLWFRWRWTIIKVVFAAAFITAIISLIIPKTYRSTAVVFPPYEGGMALPFMEGISIDIFGRNEIPASGLISLLKSRALKDRIHEKVDLIEHYEQDDIERAYEAFEEHIEVEIESEETFGKVTIIAIAVSILDYDPEYCARMVNLLMNNWDRLYIELSRHGASLRRQYVEENLHKTAADLAAVEDSLRAFQEEHGISSIEAQLEGTVQAAVMLEQKIIDTRIVVQVLGKLFQSNHPELQRAKMELQELYNQQKQLKQSDSDKTLLLPLGKAPEVSLAYTRIYRRVKTLEAINQILVQQYEQAKMQELKDTPAIRIVDYGEVPINKYKPKRAILVIIATFSALFMSLVLVYFLDYVNRNEGSEESRWLDEIIELLKSDFKKISGIFKLGTKN